MQDAREEDQLSSEASDYGDPDTEPGATIMWFGMYQNIRLDKLPEWYRRTLVHWSNRKPSSNLRKFRTLREEYLAWLDQRQSPLSTLIWFGKFQGHEMRLHYNAPRRWRYLLNYEGGKWRDDLLEIEQRYLLWRETHPGKEYAPRAPANVVHPMGEKLGPKDDGAASDNDEGYDSDGGFVVSDDQEDEQTSSMDEDPDHEEVLSELESPDGESNGNATDQDSSERTGSDAVDSDSSAPNLAGVPKTTTPTSSPPSKSRLRRKLESKNLGRRPGARDHGNSESDTDAPIVPPPVLEIDRRKRKRLMVTSSSDNEDEDDDDLIDETSIPGLRKLRQSSIRIWLK